MIDTTVAENGQFYSCLSNLEDLIFFSCPIALVRISSVMLYRWKVDTLADFRVKASIFSPMGMTLVLYLSPGLYYAEANPSHT